MKMNRKKREKRKVHMLFVLLGFMCFISGCQNKVDIEDRNYVMSLGIQQAEENAGEETTKNTEELVKKKEKKESEEVREYQFIYEMADLTKTSEEGGGRQQGKMRSYTGASLEETEKKQQKTDDKRIDYGHLKAILLKESLWKEENVDKIAEELSQKREIAGTTLLFLTEENPEVYMEIANKEGSSLGEYLERMMANHAGDGAEEYTLSDFLREWREDSLWSSEGKKTDSKKQIPYLKMEQKEIYLTYWNREEKGAISFENTSQEKSNRISLENPSQEAVARNVLRFHVRANSDSEEDQAIKVRIKDRILPYLQQLLKGCTSKDECMSQVTANIGEIQKTVKEACDKEEQMDLESKVYLCQEFFPVKEYGDILLPSGCYDALRIDLGEGLGKNWWCMMYPSLCMVDGVIEGVDQESKEILQEGLTEEECESLFSKRKEHTSVGEEKKEMEVHFHIKWKIGELWKKFFATD